MLDDVLALARQAGDAILAVVAERALAPTLKADDSPVTAADLAADRVIAAGLAALDPATPVVSEEQERVHDGALARFWLVDPLDGTREFVRGGDDYTVNIALVENGVPVLGVVHAPARGVSYAAARGGGAVRTDASGTRRISVRRAPEELAVVASRSHGGEAMPAFLPRCRRTRSCRSAARSRSAWSRTAARTSTRAWARPRGGIPRPRTPSRSKPAPRS